MGSSGEVLHANFPDDGNTLFLNAHLCWPPDTKKDQKMTQRLTAACRSRLLEEIQAHPRRLIVAMGAGAAWGVTGNFGIKITQVRGQLWPSNLSELGVLFELHPAALLRGLGSYTKFKRNCLYAHYLLRTGVPKRPEPPTWEVIRTPRRLTEVVKEYAQHPLIAADVETSSLNPRDGTILDFGMCHTPGEVHIIPFREPAISRTIGPALRFLFSANRPQWVWHNGKFDTRFFRGFGLEAPFDEDTMLQSYVQDETPGIHDLEQVASDILGAPNYKDMLKPYLPNKKTSYEVIPEPLLHEYLAKDVSLTWLIHDAYRIEVGEDAPTEKLYTKTLIPAAHFLTHMEDAGLYVDQDRLQENEKLYSERKVTAERDLQEYAGWPLLAGSWQQVHKFLYEQEFDLSLPKNRRFVRIEKKHKTAKEALELLPQTKGVRLIKDFRKASKAYGTYVKGLWAHIEDDGRIHSTYWLHRTPTGRLASLDPNLQNIPRDPQLRGTFVAPPGSRYVEGDLSQAELRSLAQMSQDPTLCAIYNDTKRSLHKEVAIDKYGVGYTKDQYIRAKAVNFGIVYGRTAHTLAEEFNLPLSEGQAMIDGWGEMFPVAWDFIRRCRRVPLHAGTITTLFGRKKRHPLVNRERARDFQNEAANFPHQSVASDITLHAAMMLRVPLSRLGATIVNIVHDSILVECPDDDTIALEVAVLMKTVMEMVAPMWGLHRVPFTADISMGYRWGSLSEMEDVQAYDHGMRMVT